MTYKGDLINSYTKTYVITIYNFVRLNRGVAVNKSCSVKKYNFKKKIVTSWEELSVKVKQKLKISPEKSRALEKSEISIYPLEQVEMYWV